MSEPLLTGINHVALAAADVDKTASFYQEVFGLEVADFSLPDQRRNVVLFFPNGSFVQVCQADVDPVASAPLSQPRDNLIYDGAPLDHFSLFASDVAALEEIRARLVALGATDGDISDIAGVAKTLTFGDPDGRIVEVTAYP